MLEVAILEVYERRLLTTCDHGSVATVASPWLVASTLLLQMEVLNAIVKQVD